MFVCVLVCAYNYMNINPFLMQFFLLVLPLIMRESMIEWIFCFTILRSTFVCVCVVTKKCNIITVYVCVQFLFDW